MTKNTDFKELAQKSNKTNYHKPLGAWIILFSEFPLYIMSNFQQKQKCNMKTKCGPYIQGIIISIETVLEETYMLSLLNNGLKSAIINMFKELSKPCQNNSRKE